MTNYSELEYSDFNGQYFVFVGQNASTGTPNSITGHMSFYGKYVGGFESRKDAVAYAEDHYDPYRNNLVVAGTARTLRKYSLGCSVRSYLDDLYMAELRCS